MVNLSIRRILIYGIISTLVMMSLTPTIIGIDDENQNLVEIEKSLINTNIVVVTELENTNDYSSNIDINNLNPLDELRKFYGFDFKHKQFNEALKQRYEDLGINKPMFSSGYWDFILKGYVKDAITNAPIKDAKIKILIIDHHFDLERIITTSDSNGYYEIYLEDIYNGEFVLFFSAESYYSTSAWPLPLREQSLIWINASLTPGAPAKNSKVCGYILDGDTLEPIQGALVDMHWKDYKDHGDWIDTYTDSSGFYSLDIAAGQVYPWGSADSYFDRYGNAEFIKDGKTGWINVYLKKRISDHAKICGYITEETTGDPIEDALIELHIDNEDIPYWDWNYTITDSSGYYEVDVIHGKIYTDILAIGYVNHWGGSFQFYDGDVYWWNTTMYKIPLQTAKICGNVTDQVTDEPIENIAISVDWDDNQGHFYYTYVLTDSSGFYEINVPPGDIYLAAYPWEHLYHLSDFYEFEINEFETVWLDFALEPFPPENSVVKGGILTNQTVKPATGGNHIRYATVSVHWSEDYQGYGYGNYTYTDANGYYEMNVPAGFLDFYCYADGYYPKSEVYIIEPYETKTFDFKLDPVDLGVNIIDPKPGFYLNNEQLFPLFTSTIIIGSIDIEVSGSENLYEVEFYIDDEYKHADISDPYTYSWNEKTFGRHKITLSCNGERDSVVNKDIFVWKFF